MTRWGVVATIKAKPLDVLNFVAYHLDLGADHIFIYLDQRTPRALEALQPHPKVTVQHTDSEYWTRENGRKPPKHQGRQTVNATHAYGLASGLGLDWICHIDVDEFLCPDRDIRDALESISLENPGARLRPAEALSTDGITGLDPAATYCKAWMETGYDRRSVEEDLYPKYGGYLRGGFVSHHVGKLFLRTGISDVSFRIHRAFQNGEELRPTKVLPSIPLCHRHITSWDHLKSVLEFRMQKGSYRAELKPTRKAEAGGMSLHEIFSFLQSEGGEEAVKEFFEELCLARPELIDKLNKHGLLRVFHLGLDEKRQKHFPAFR
ncbi:glycosyl transferase family 2 [Shimia isoporae]|uniref:Glycosyl transferase family 2 n=1 Tax=Shimia isoporae TaxID=647720 RepID=A0A4R1NXD3_9RHOB|nr:glycosyltransferase family 2 protein [Shimia isoporae]TCL09832.1 glycosyl transferase family 2 [Shimia isoporae]